jgi:hypothetical protein
MENLVRDTLIRDKHVAPEFMADYLEDQKANN